MCKVSKVRELGAKRCGIKLKLCKKKAESFMQTELHTRNENQSLINRHEMVVELLLSQIKPYS